jgi:hypothetical protein
MATLMLTAAVLISLAVIVIVATLTIVRPVWIWEAELEYANPAAETRISNAVKIKTLIIAVIPIKPAVKENVATPIPSSAAMVLAVIPRPRNVVMVSASQNVRLKTVKAVVGVGNLVAVAHLG